MKDRKSIKQFYRLWYEFLKLGLTQTKFTKKEKEFYLDWGDVLSYKNFDEWWKSREDIPRVSIPLILRFL